MHLFYAHNHLHTADDLHSHHTGPTELAGTTWTPPSSVRTGLTPGHREPPERRRIWAYVTRSGRPLKTSPPDQDEEATAGLGRVRRRRSKDRVCRRRDAPDLEIRREGEKRAGRKGEKRGGRRGGREALPPLAPPSPAASSAAST
uniref:Uncharacterized protein n=1 Tax=Oryza meridionalis TaxID=40149 RepID=A0A0E0D389_9ORYZ